MQCLFYFLPSSDNAAHLAFVVKYLKITSFFLFPQELLQVLWEFAAQQTNKQAKNVHDISSHSCLTLSALVEEPRKFDSAVGR